MTSCEDSRSQRERMEAGDLYIAADPELEEQMAHASRLAYDYLHQSRTGDPAAASILSALVGEIGEGVTVRAPLFVDYGRNLSIGARTFVNVNLVALDVAPIRIGVDCQIGPNVQLLTPTHPTDPEPRREKWEAAKPITIGDNVWLGGGVIVCPGVTGSGSRRCETVGPAGIEPTTSTV